MPLLPYDTVGTMLNFARVRLNDSIQSVGGEVLTNTQVFTANYVNAAWRKLQSQLASLGFVRLESESVIFSLPALTLSDLSASVWLNWAGSFDGTNTNSTPTLPTDLIYPKEAWERVAGVNGSFLEMDRLAGFPLSVKRTRNVFWDWRSDKLYLAGATSITDLRIRYVAYIADFPTLSTGAIDPTQPITILRVLSPFAYFVCYEVSSARGDQTAMSDFQRLAVSECQQLVNDPAFMQQKVS